MKKPAAEYPAREDAPLSSSIGGAVEVPFPPVVVAVELDPPVVVVVAVEDSLEVVASVVAALG